MAVGSAHLKCQWEVKAGATGRSFLHVGSSPAKSIAKLTQREGLENPQLYPQT